LHKKKIITLGDMCALPGYYAACSGNYNTLHNIPDEYSSYLLHRGSLKSSKIHPTLQWQATHN